jgi:hypothetical protein
MTIQRGHLSTDPRRDGILTRSGDTTHLPPCGEGVLHLAARGGAVEISIASSDGPSSSRRSTQLGAGSEIWLRAGSTASITLDRVGAGAALVWSWSPEGPPGGDGATLLAAAIVVGVLTPVPSGAYEVELYRSGPGNWTWSVQVSPPFTLPPVPVPASPVRWYAGGSHYLSTCPGAAVWRLRSL